MKFSETLRRGMKTQKILNKSYYARAQFHHHQGVTAEFNSSDLTQENNFTGKSESVSGSPGLPGHNRNETTNGHI